MSKVKTISDCQYCTIVIRRETRFMWTFVHMTKKTNCHQKLEDMVRTKHGVTEIRHSNEHQQFQNVLVEKCVDIRDMLL